MQVNLKYDIKVYVIVIRKRTKLLKRMQVRSLMRY